VLGCVLKKRAVRDCRLVRPIGISIMCLHVANICDRLPVIRKGHVVLEIIVRVHRSADEMLVFATRVRSVAQVKFCRRLPLLPHMVGVIFLAILYIDFIWPKFSIIQSKVRWPSWLWRQVKVILTLLPGHESGVGSSK
jgi:hypothetical protein